MAVHFNLPGAESNKASITNTIEWIFESTALHNNCVSEQSFKCWSIDYQNQRIHFPNELLQSTQ